MKPVKARYCFFWINRETGQSKLLVFTSHDLCFQCVNFSAILISLGFHDISNGYHANHLSTIVDNGQVPKTAFGHDMGHRHDVVFGHADHDIFGHHVTHSLREYILILCGPTHDIPFREDATKIARIVDNNYRANPMFSQPGYGFSNQITTRDRNDSGWFGCQNVTYFHEKYPPKLLPQGITSRAATARTHHRITRLWIAIRIIPSEVHIKYNDQARLAT
jgi:hypothetical protein